MLHAWAWQHIPLLNGFNTTYLCLTAVFYVMLMSCGLATGCIFSPYAWCNIEDYTSSFPSSQFPNIPIFSRFFLIFPDFPDAQVLNLWGASPGRPRGLPDPGARRRARFPRVSPVHWEAHPAVLGIARDRSTQAPGGCPRTRCARGQQRVSWP